jgi:hypothetical protein
VNGQKIRPSRHWYWLVAGLAATTVLLIALAVLRFLSLNQQIISFQRIQPPGQRTLTFTSSGQYLVYFEGPVFGGASPSSPGSVPLLLQSQASGQQVRVSSLRGQANFYNIQGHAGTAEGSFTIVTPGRYTLRAGQPDSPGMQDIAIGRGIANGTLAASVEFIVGVLTLIAGVVVVIVIALRRGRNRRRREPGEWPYLGPDPQLPPYGSYPQRPQYGLNPQPGPQQPYRPYQP